MVAKTIQPVGGDTVRLQRLIDELSERLDNTRVVSGNRKIVQFQGGMSSEGYRGFTQDKSSAYSNEGQGSWDGHQHSSSGGYQARTPTTTSPE